MPTPTLSPIQKRVLALLRDHADHTRASLNEGWCSVPVHKNGGPNVTPMGTVRALARLGLIEYDQGQGIARILQAGRDALAALDAGTP